MKKLITAILGATLSTGAYAAEKTTTMTNQELNDYTAWAKGIQHLQDQADDLSLKYGPLLQRLRADLAPPAPAAEKPPAAPAPGGEPPK